MVDRIPKINQHDHARVDEAKDATEEQGQATPDEGEEDEDRAPTDGFNTLLDKTNWQIILDQPRANQRKLEIPVKDVSEIRFQKINLKTNPSLLNIQVSLKDGMTYPSAYVALPRHAAVLFQHMKTGGLVDIQDVTEEKVLTLFVPELKSGPTDEITRVTKSERTFSQTFKLLVKKTWLMRIGLQDPETKRTNTEVALVYVTIIVILFSIAFAAYWIMR